mmetsp:Transcript_18364/g.47026  ORF Transcript_18364/g.47026 Transcript_18364/m.47026 type:complete len:295 (-) Transcript_18364:54-938(-)
MPARRAAQADGPVATAKQLRGRHPIGAWDADAPQGARPLEQQSDVEHPGAAGPAHRTPSLLPPREPPRWLAAGRPPLQPHRIALPPLRKEPPDRRGADRRGQADEDFGLPHVREPARRATSGRDRRHDRPAGPTLARQPHPRRHPRNDRQALPAALPRPVQQRDERGRAPGHRQPDQPAGALPAERTSHACTPVLLPPAHPQRRKVLVARGARGVPQDDRGHVRRHVRHRLRLQQSAAQLELRCDLMRRGLYYDYMSTASTVYVYGVPCKRKAVRGPCGPRRGGACGGPLCNHP